MHWTSFLIGVVVTLLVSLGVTLILIATATAWDDLDDLP